MNDVIQRYGKCLELVPLDPHFHDISIALYEQRPPEAGFVIHTYSSMNGADERIAFAASAMRVLGGMTSSETHPRVLRFTCGSDHLLGCKRIFLESCKIAPGSPLEPRPLAILDKKSGLTISVTGEGEGAYRVTADSAEGDGARRIAIAADVRQYAVDGKQDVEQFSSACDHIESLPTLFIVPALFGDDLGEATEVARVRVHWPSGDVETWSDVAIDRWTTLTVGSGQ